MSYVPLAERLRPQKLSDVVGQEEIIGPGKILTEIVKRSDPVNLILWGPAGTGKTTLARILAREFHAEFYELSAVTAGKKDVLEIIEQAKQNWNLHQRTVLFVDEIHRFNKAQQDAFLPHLESGLITLIGATTENPSFEIIAPLLSRSRIVVLTSLDKTSLQTIIARAMQFIKCTINDDANDFLVALAAGDARFALNTLELAASFADRHITIAHIQQAAGRKFPAYDKNGDFHYHLISAFIKSMRGSDANAALYYLARMLQAGEDPKFIARRMVIFASEDIGLSANGALSLATSAFLAVERVGMPESGIILSHVTVALARNKKSRVTYDAWRRAEQSAAHSPNAPVPLALRNASTSLMADLGYGEGMKWQAGFHLDNSYFPEEVGEQDFFKSH